MTKSKLRTSYLVFRVQLITEGSQDRNSRQKGGRREWRFIANHFNWNFFIQWIVLI